MNTFGTHFRLTTFGESHGPAIGGIIDGMPPGVEVGLEAVQEALDRRRPGQAGATRRQEADRVEVLSGIYRGRSLGTPIGFIIRNTDCRPGDYDAELYRPGHADFTTDARYGERDPRGGGRASARETACRVVGGAFAEQVLARLGVKVKAWVEGIGPDGENSIEVLERARAARETLGGVVGAEISGLEAGIGSPVYGKLSARLAEAMMGINAAKGVEIGMGFEGARSLGSEVIDPFIPTPEGGISTSANHSGGIQGGISNGAPVTLRVAFKPIATMPGRPLPTVDRQGHPAELTACGRHDVSAVPRAVAVVRAMAAMTVVDLIMDRRGQNIFGP